MAEAGFLEQRRTSPTTVAVVVLLHAGVLGALALSKMSPVIDLWPGPMRIENIPLDPVPPPDPVERKVEVKQRPQTETHLDFVPPIVPTKATSEFVVRDAPLQPPLPPLPPGHEAVVEPPVEPLTPLKVEPVRTIAQLDPRYADRLQPPYPPSEEREGVQGRVTVRILIGADGRVKEVERVSAVSEGLWRATERHARTNWRFKPATADGEPVESRKTMSVVFEIKG